jgi:hypothetical protein
MEDKNQDKNFDLLEEEGVLSEDLEKENSSAEQDEFDFGAKNEDDEEELKPMSPNFREEKHKSQDIIVSRSKIVLAKKLLVNIKENNEKLLEIFSFLAPTTEDDLIGISQIGETIEDSEDIINNGQSGKIIEGVFDGENMIGPDGKQYSVPANYASKSKLVEGDILKLTITPRGTFVYKQIGPIERSRVIGELEKDGNGNFFVRSEGKQWRVLPASVTYFKGNPGDETIILIPKAGESKWAAVENIVREQE